MQAGATGALQTQNSKPPSSTLPTTKAPKAPTEMTNIDKLKSHRKSPKKPPKQGLPRREQYWLGSLAAWLRACPRGPLPGRATDTESESWVEGTEEGSIGIMVSVLVSVHIWCPIWGTRSQNQTIYLARISGGAIWTVELRDSKSGSMAQTSGLGFGEFCVRSF